MTRQMTQNKSLKIQLVHPQPIPNVALVAIAGTTILAPYLVVKSLQLIWR